MFHRRHGWELGAQQALPPIWLSQPWGRKAAREQCQPRLKGPRGLWTTRGVQRWCAALTALRVTCPLLKELDHIPGS